MDDLELIPYDESMEVEDAYLLGDAELKELIAETKELLVEAENVI